MRNASAQGTEIVPSKNSKWIQDCKGPSDPWIYQFHPFHTPIALITLYIKTGYIVLAHFSYEEAVPKLASIDNQKPFILRSQLSMATVII